MAVYDYLLTVADGTYTATNFGGVVVSSNTSLATVINAIKATGVKIKMGVGTFDYGANTPTFNTLHGMQFWGSGIDRTIVQNNSDAAADTEVFNFTTCDDVVIRDLTVHAQGVARATSDAIDNDGGARWLVERVKVTSSRARGIVFDGKDTVDRTCAGGIIRNCVITGTTGAITAGSGIQLLAASDCIVEDNTIYDTSGHGIALSKGAPGAGVPNRKPTVNIVRRNTITKAGAHGININSGDDNIIEYNTILNSAFVTANNDGIRISTSDTITADRNLIRNNTCSDNQGTKTQRYGVNIGPAAANQANNNEITNNVLTGNLLSAYNDIGTGTVITGNTT